MLYHILIIRLKIFPYVCQLCILTSLFNVTSPFSFLDESYLNATKYMYTVTKEFKVGHNNDIYVGKVF